MQLKNQCSQVNIFIYNLVPDDIQSDRNFTLQKYGENHAHLFIMSTQYYLFNIKFTSPCTYIKTGSYLPFLLEVAIM